MHWLWAADARWVLSLSGHPAWLRPTAVFVLRAARAGICWLALFGLLFLIGGRRGRRIALTGCLAVLLAHAGAVWGLQGLVQRALPAASVAGVHLVPLRHPPFSFPAERTAQAFAAAPLLTRGSGAGPVVVWALALAVAWADAFSGFYYPTDILGGALVGLAGAAAAVWLLGDPFHRPRGHLVPLSPRMRPARVGGPARGRRRATR